MIEHEVTENGPSNSELRRAGVHFGVGLSFTVMMLFGLIRIAVESCVILALLLGIGQNNSDLDGVNRSGFKVWTDYGTRVQYLVTPEGHAIPRVNKDGETILIPDSKK